jgi:hypothetical protein
MLLPPGVYDLEGSPYFTNAGIPRLEFDSVPIRADTTVDLVLDGTPIRGIVRGQAGAPLAGVAITVDRPGAWSEARSLADGSYTIYAPPGVYRARLYPEPPLDYILSRETPLVVGDTPTTRDFDLSGVSWTGTVRWAGTGQPVSGATVMVYEATFAFGSAECTADATGMFRLVVKSGGLYQLVARGGSPPLSYSQFVGFITAGADSSFDILLGPEGQPARYTTTAPALTRE